MPFPGTVFMLEELTLDPELQLRAGGLVERAVVDYMEVIKDGGTFKTEPVVFSDGETHWLADGFHRVEAINRCGIDHVTVTKHRGNKREAMVFAAEANQANGERFTLADRKNAAKRLLEYYPAKSNNWIAEKAGVNNKTVARLREGDAPKPVKPKAERQPKEFITTTSPIEGENVVKGMPDTVTEEPTTLEESATDDMHDQLGREVPEALRPIFRDRDAARRLSIKITGVITDLNDLIGNGFLAHIDGPLEVRKLMTIKEALKYSVPYAVCPYCGGLTCTACQASGYVTQARWERIPLGAKSH